MALKTVNVECVKCRTSTVNRINGSNVASHAGAVCTTNLFGFKAKTIERPPRSNRLVTNRRGMQGLQNA